jgi:hypothetical protein
MATGSSKLGMHLDTLSPSIISNIYAKRCKENLVLLTSQVTRDDPAVTAMAEKREFMTVAVKPTYLVKNDNQR